MKEVTFIFVNTKRNIFQKFIGWIITSFEHGATDFASHVAIQFDYLKGYGPTILEALGQGVVLSNCNKYDTDADQCRITISLNEEDYNALEQKAIEIAEHKYSYSYLSCLIGGIANSFSKRFANFLARLLNAEKDDEMDCSETATKLIRTVHQDFCKDLAGAQITPYDCYIQMAIDALEGKLVIAKITKYGVK